MLYDTSRTEDRWMQKMLAARRLVFNAMNAGLTVRGSSFIQLGECLAVDARKAI